MKNSKKIIALLCALIFSLVYAGCFAEDETVVVPDVVGMNVKDADELLDKMGVPSVQLYFSQKDIEENIVFMQKPEKNETLRKDDTVILSVSSGPRRFNAPDLVGMNIEEATDLLMRQGIIPIRERVAGDGSAVDTVIFQSPAADEEMSENDYILIRYVSEEVSDPVNASGSPNKPGFYETGLEVAGVLDQMVQSRDFLDLFLNSADHTETLDTVFNTGDYDKPLAVYRLNQTDMKDWIKSMLKDNELDRFNSISPVLQDQLLARAKGAAYLSNIINARKGVDTLALTTVLQAQLDIPGLEAEPAEYWLFVYEKGVPVLVSLGWHRAVGTFLVLSAEETESLETIQALLNPYGFEISQVDIPQA